MTFTGNHDITRIASRTDDERHLTHTIVLLVTLPGTPCVYYGDEQGQCHIVVCISTETDTPVHSELTSSVPRQKYVVDID